MLGRMRERPNDRVRVRRGPEKARYDLVTVQRVLDRGLVAHVAFVDAGGSPVCVPMLYARCGDRLFLHGSSASRAMRTLGARTPACLTVTLLDGIVLARSAYEHSANYESAMLFGSCRAVTDGRELEEALRGFTEKLVPGRWDEIREPSELELRATHVLEFSIDDAAVKVRSGGPDDDHTDDALRPVWAGHVPIRLTYGAPVRAASLSADVALPRDLADLAGTTR
jgi:nitroimidazol reductase NimA-like FMN-containing flavoprotein (pyridoxamine 5'-phosphate oxidase superfamily)